MGAPNRCPEPPATTIVQTRTAAAAAKTGVPGIGSRVLGRRGTNLLASMGHDTHAYRDVLAGIEFFADAPSDILAALETGA